MHYTNEEIEEIKESVNEQLRQDEECRRQILETIAFKKRQHAEDIAKKVIAEQGLIVSDDEFQQIVEHVMQLTNRQGNQGAIVVNEINIEGAL